MEEFIQEGGVEELVWTQNKSQASIARQAEVSKAMLNEMVNNKEYAMRASLCNVIKILRVLGMELIVREA